MTSLAGKQVLIVSAFGPGSGYGKDGIALAQHIEDAGAFVHLDPSSVGVPLPLDVAKMLARPRPDYFDLMLQHAEPPALNMPPHVVNTGRVGRTLAWTMAEFGSYGGEEFEPLLQGHLAGFDAFLGYTQLTLDVTKPYLPQDCASAVLMGGYEADLFKPNDEDPVRDWDGTFRYGMVITNTRKNPFATLAAFNRLKDEHPDFDAELHFKTNNLFVPPQVHDPDNGIYVHHEGWTHAQMRAFHACNHVLVCPSLGEGKSLPPLEAGTMGCPSILSACSGHVDWANTDIAWLVNGQTRERDPVRFPGQTAFYVDEEALAEAMWDAYARRAKTRIKGENASRIIPQMQDWSKVIERLAFWLDDTKPRTRPVPEVGTDRYLQHGEWRPSTGPS